MREALSVDLVDDLEVAEVDQIDGRPHDVIKREPRRIEHSGEVVQNTLCLLCDASFDELSRLRHERNLPAQKYKPGGANGLRIRPYRLGGALGGNDGLHEG